MDLIIHHKSCPDGWCAAFIAKKKYPEAQIMARDHGTNPPYAEVEGKDVLVVDFSWRTREENIRLSKLAKSFQIFDHHKSAKTELEGLPFATFDMERSGAGITWDLLFPGVPRPWYVRYVEDRDLWRHSLFSSEKVNAYLMTLPHTIVAWSELDHMDWQDAEILGAGALRHVEHYTEKACEQVQEGIFEDFTTGVVNVPYLNVSEVAGRIAETHEVGFAWFERGDGQTQFSLRSRGSGPDVSLLAKKYGGGGHKNAAGFQLSLKQGRDLVDRILGR